MRGIFGRDHPELVHIFSIASVNFQYEFARFFSFFGGWGVVKVFSF